MADSSTRPLGFLSVVGTPEEGFLGGYLLVTSSGRPLEFHCTTPVLPSRAQVILYGSTLCPHLYGELIGQTLLKQATRRVVAVLVDSADGLHIRPYADVPVAAVVDPATTESAYPSQSSDSAQTATLDEFLAGGHRLRVAPRYAADRTAVVSVLAGAAASLDLREPFARIQAAIDEARRMSA